MSRRGQAYAAAAAMLALAAAAVRAGPPRIELKPAESGAWRVHVHGEPFPIRGAGGATAPGLLEALKDAGGNTVRTWGIETLEERFDDGERFIDRAGRLGIMVVAGLWVEHERHGFDYTDRAFIRRQRKKLTAAVRRYKDHPAILAWGLGNEMEGPSSRAGSARVFRELNTLARLVKKEDPTRPVISAIAFTPEKAKAMARLCPAVDILGVNSYGGAAGAGAALKAAGWLKPFAVTEFGPRGFWEVPAADWGAPFEPTSEEKARSFYATHRLVFELNEGHERCLGTFAFLWGWKQECTATWFGMFLPTGEKLGPVDAMTRAWTGAWPANRCPRLHEISSPAFGQVLPPGQRQTAAVRADDPDGDPLSYEWLVVSESADRREGGEAEAAPPAHPGLVEKQHEPEGVFTTPSEPGAYRLFLTIRDGRGGAATANFPFRVER